MTELQKLPNIGKAVEAQLLEVGIVDCEALKKEGSKSAWLKIQKIDSSACYNRLMGLEGAVRGIPKKMLPDDVKTDLKAFYDAHKIPWK